MRIISAPFGNYLRRPGWTSTIGTFTPKYRGGLLYRLWRCAKTLRYDREYGGWRNKLGLPNPGMQYLIAHPLAAEDRILSIGVAHDDSPETWAALLSVALECTANGRFVRAIEINASCPNEERGLTVSTMLARASRILTFDQVYVKIPPIGYEELVEHALDCGFNKFHACNTIPTPKGGVSGPSLRGYVRSAVKHIRMLVPAAEIIAGGGVQHPDDAKMYRDCGANHVAVGSAWFNPLLWKQLEKIEA